MLKKQIENIDKTARAALAYTKEYHFEYAKALCIPIFIILLVSVTFPDYEDSVSGLYVWSLFLMMPLYIWIVIVTHRITLLGSESVNPWGAYLPGKRELNFIIYSIGLSLVAIPLAFLMAIPVLGPFLFYVLAGYLVSRLSLVIPAIAIDNHYSFIDSWHATKEHQIFIIAIVWLFPMIISLPLELFHTIPQIELIVSFVSILVYVFTIVMLSIAFKIIDENDKIT